MKYMVLETGGSYNTVVLVSPIDGALEPEYKILVFTFSFGPRCSYLHRGSPVPLK